MQNSRALKTFHSAFCITYNKTQKFVNAQGPENFGYVTAVPWP